MLLTWCESLVSWIDCTLCYKIDKSMASPWCAFLDEPCSYRLERMTSHSTRTRKLWHLHAVVGGRWDWIVFGISCCTHYSNAFDSDHQNQHHWRTSSMEFSWLPSSRILQALVLRFQWERKPHRCLHLSCLRTLPQTYWASSPDCYLRRSLR